METYKIIRGYMLDHPSQIIKEGLTLEEAKAHCKDPETSSSTCKEKENVERTLKYGPWFDSFEDE